jgi:hypothetical protein
MTTKRDEVQIAAPVMPLQGIAHGRETGPRRIQNPHRYKPRGAAPTVTSAAYKGSCTNDILTRCHMNQAHSLRHPPNGNRTSAPTQGYDNSNIMTSRSGTQLKPEQIQEAQQNKTTKQCTSDNGKTTCK